jgi:hypothetical protein
MERQSAVAALRDDCADLLGALEREWSGDRAGQLEAIIRDSDIQVERSSWSG